MDVGMVETMTATVVVAPATPKQAIPPVTPSKATSTAAARARMIDPPGQPRKTPLGKRTSSAALVGESDESDESEDELDALPSLLAPSRPRARTGPSQPTTNGTTTRRPAVPPESEQRPTRVTRASAAAAAARVRPRTPPPVSPTKGGAATGSRPSPNKIPRLATRAASPQPPRSPSAMATRSTRGAVPSRLPTLIVHTRRTNNAGAPAKTGTGKEGSEKERDAWMKNNPSAVVKPGTKSERPGLRSIRKRRSSFSAADVVA